MGYSFVFSSSRKPHAFITMVLYGFEFITGQSSWATFVLIGLLPSFLFLKCLMGALQYCAGSGVHQHEPAVGAGVPVEPPSHFPPHPRLGCTDRWFHRWRFTRLRSILPFIPPSPPALRPQVCPQCLCLHCCPTDRLLSAISLEPVHMH